MTWEEIQAEGTRRIDQAVTNTLNYAREQWIKKYAAGVGGVKLTSAGNYVIGVRTGGNGASGYIYPNATPGPSIHWSGAYTVPYGMLPDWYENGSRVNLPLSRKGSHVFYPAVPTRAAIQNVANQRLLQELKSVF